MDNKKQKKGRIFINNLIFDINEKILRKLFNKFGEIIDVKIPLSNVNNKPKGYGFVEFENKNNALKAINELNESKFKGRVIKLSLAKDQRMYNENNIKIVNKEDSTLVDEIKNNEEKDLDIVKDNEIEKENSINFEEQNNLSDEDDEPKEKKSLFENEDLSKTVFIKNILFETTKKDFFNFCKKFGEIEYAKLVMRDRKEDEKETHKGTGFVKFTDIKIAQSLITKSKMIEENPLLASKFDPLNELDLNERKLIFKNAVNKNSIKDDFNNNNNINKKRKNIKTLIEDDKNDKRNLKSCLYGTISSLRPENISEKEINIRKEHIKEKIIKMQNPNFFCSKTTILFKNINEELNEKTIKLKVSQIISKYLDKKDFLNKKIIKRMRLFLKNNQNNFSGICLVDFIKTKHANIFLENIINKENYSLFFNRFNHVPLIEFAFDDIRKVNKVKEKLLNKKIQKDKTKIDLVDKKTKLDNIEIAQELNRKNLAKKYFKIFSESNQKEDKELALEYINKLKSRGLKQRLLNKMNEKPNLNKEIIDEPIIKEKLITKIIKKSKPIMSESDKIIKKKIKNNKKFKKKEFEKNAEMDKFEKKHLHIN